MQIQKQNAVNQVRIVKVTSETGFCSLHGALPCSAEPGYDIVEAREAQVGLAAR